MINDKKTEDDSVEFDDSNKTLLDANLKFNSTESPIFKSPLSNFESPNFEFSQDDRKTVETAHNFQSIHITSNPESVDIFESINLMIGNKQGAFIAHIHDTPVFSTAQAQAKLALLFEDWKKAKEQGVANNFLFEIIFSCEEQLKERS